MNTDTKSQIPPRRLERSILALLAGIVVGIVLSVGTDLGLHAIGVVPAQSERWPNQLLLLATTYRSIYGVIGLTGFGVGYDCGLLARPMGTIIQRSFRSAVRRTASARQ